MMSIDPGYNLLKVYPLIPLVGCQYDRDKGGIIKIRPFLQDPFVSLCACYSYAK
jgi:hypothetical protein